MAWHNIWKEDSEKNEVEWTGKAEIEKKKSETKLEKQNWKGRILSRQNSLQCVKM